MLSRQIIVCKLMLLLIFNVEAQNSYQIIINKGTDEVGGYSTVDDSGNIYFTSIYWNWNDSLYYPLLYKVSAEGDTCSSSVLSQKDTIYSYNNIIRAYDGNLIIVGRGIVKNEGDIFRIVMKVNQNLELIWLRKYHTDFQGLGTELLGHAMELKDSSLIFVGSFEGSGQRHMYAFHLTSQGDSILYKLFPPEESGLIYSITYNPDSTLIWLHTAGVTPEITSSERVVIDHEFNILQIIDYPFYFITPFHAKLLSKTKLGVSSVFSDFTTDGFYIMAAIFDTTLILTDSILLTHPDTNAYPAWLNSIDFYYSNSIFIGGTINFQAFGGFEPSWFYITKLDTNLNIYYEKYFGGDLFYSMFSIVAMQDGGVALIGTIRDFNATVFDRDIIIIKLDTNGYVKILEESQIKIQSAIVYPNPGNDRLFVRTALKSVNFELFDLYGRRLKVLKINNLITELNIANLKSGIYTWRLTNSKEILEYGKWIKN